MILFFTYPYLCEYNSINNRNIMLYAVVVAAVISSCAGGSTVATLRETDDSEPILKQYVPDAVENLKNHSRTESSICFSWNEPKDRGGLSISYYLLSCEGGNFKISYNVTKNLQPETFFNVTRLLTPGAEYHCKVAACNALGCSDFSSTRVFTQPPSALPPPIPEIQEGESTESSIAIHIDLIDCCSVYRVIVQVVDGSRSTRQAEGSHEGTFPEDCSLEGASCYIAAQLNKSDLPMVFIIGDNHSYNGYVNPPLLSDRQYKIWYAAGNIADGVERFNYSSLAPVFAKQYMIEKEASMSPVLIGIVSGLFVVVLLVGLVLFFWIRQRKNKLLRFRTPDSEKTLELNEHGSLLHNGSYHKGDAVSVDSLDATKQPNGEPVYDNVKLKHFPVLVEELREYIAQKSLHDGFKKEYNLIPWGLKFSHEVAKHPDNKVKNRYGNIIAYDHSRVILRGKHPDQDTDYVNANYIDGYITPKEYIATQGPTKFTVNDMWHMAWQERSPMIVMVTNTIELSRHKCEQYWPEEGSAQYGNIKVTICQSKCLAHYKIRTFTMEQDNECRTIKQYHFTAWPDHGTPTHATTLLSFLKKVRQNKDSKAGPIICHCSAGVGRSGTFIALDSLLQQAASEGKVDVYSYVTQMRKQRCNMIQTLDQYVFLHYALLEASECFNTAISIKDFKPVHQSLSKDMSKLDTQYHTLQALQYEEKNTDALSQNNQDKNRSNTVIPFNSRRVRLLNMPSDYINATYVDDHRKRSCMIAAQHPLNSTIEEFWKMVHSEKAVTLISLCASSAKLNITLKEDLPKFWPEVMNEVSDYTSVSVQLKEEGVLEQIPSVRRQALTISAKSQVFQQPPIEAEHFICNFWHSDKPIPSDDDAFIRLVTLIERLKKANDDQLIIVNCYDGASQSGLFLVCLSLLQQIIMDGEVDIPETVKLLRNDQPMFIKSLAQYQYCYKFVEDFIEKFNED